MSDITQGEVPHISAADFGDQDDRPVGALLSRIAQVRYGETPAEELTAIQMDFAAGLEARANKAFSSPHLLDLDTPASGSMDLEVGGRYLPLKVDTGFGRFGGFVAQSLVPYGGWTYQLDAQLLRLWVEEEAQAVANTWRSQLAAAQTRAPSEPTASVVAAAARRRAEAGPIAQTIPAAVRQALTPKREQLRRAMLRAAQGDTAPLQQLLAGDEYQRVMRRLRAVNDEFDASPTDEAPATTAGLDLGSVAVLAAAAADLPAFSIDASEDDFDFDLAADQLIARTRAAAESRARRAASAQPPGQSTRTGTPGTIANLSQQRARTASRRLGRMFAAPAADRARAQAQAFAEMGLPVLAEVVARDVLESTPDDDVATAPIPGRPTSDGDVPLSALPLAERIRRLTLGLGAQPKAATTEAQKTIAPVAARAADPSHSLSAAIAQLGETLVTGLSLDEDDAGSTALGSALDMTLGSVGRRAAGHPVGATSLRGVAVSFDPADAGHAVSSLWMADGGRGVLLAGLDGDEIRRPAPALAAPQSRALATPAVARAEQAVAATPDLAAETTISSALRSALTALTPVAQTRRPTAQQRLTALGRRPADLPQTPSAPTYEVDATTTGNDFATMLATSMVRNVQRVAHTPPRLSISAETETTGDAPATDPMAARRSHDPVVLQDVAIARDYFRALTSSLDRAVDALGRLTDPMSPVSRRLLGATPATTSQRRPTVARLRQLRERARRIARLSGFDSATAMLQRLPSQADARMASDFDDQGAAAEVAAEIADVIRGSYTLPGLVSSSIEGRAGYTTFGADSVLIAQPPAAAGPGAEYSEPATERAVQRAVEQAVAEVKRAAASQVRIDQLVAAPIDRDITPTPTLQQRRLQLFSPEKTLALLAPQLESGGLLDTGSRAELTSAVRELARTDRPAARRRVRTAFGTLELFAENGRLSAHIEEISSNAPTVSLSAPSHAAEQPAPPVMPTETAQRLAELTLGAPAPLQARMRQLTSAARQGRLDVGQLAELTELVASRGRSESARSDLSRAVTVELGRQSRAERLAGVELDKASPIKLDVDDVEERVALGRAATSPTSAAWTVVRDDAAGDLVAVLGASTRAAASVEAMTAARAGANLAASTPVLMAGDPDSVRQLAAQTGLDVPTIARLAETTVDRITTSGMTTEELAKLVGTVKTRGSVALALGTQTVGAGQVGRAIASLSTRRRQLAALTRVAMADAGQTPGLIDGVAQIDLATLSAPLTEADESRVVGSLGRVGMGTTLEGYQLTRADIAFLTPFNQRPTGDARSRRAQASTPTEIKPTAARIAEVGRTLASVTPSRMLELGLSVGRSGDLLGAARRLGMSQSVVDAIEQGQHAGMTVPDILGFDPTPAGLGGTTNVAWDRLDENLVATGAARATGDGYAQRRLRQMDRAVAQIRSGQLPTGAESASARADHVTQRSPLTRGSLVRRVADLDSLLTSLTRSTGAERHGMAGQTALFSQGVGLGDMVAVQTGSTRPPRRLTQAVQRSRAATLGMTDVTEAKTAQSPGNERVGVTGVWIPEGLARMTGATPQTFTGGGYMLDGALVAPTVFSAARQELASPSRAGRSPDFQRIAHGMALGLASFVGKTMSATGYGPGGSMVNLGVGSVARSGHGRWMTGTSAQRSAHGIMQLLGIEDAPTAPAAYGSSAPSMPSLSETFVGLPQGGQSQSLWAEANRQRADAEKAAAQRKKLAAQTAKRQSPGYGSSDFSTGRELFNPFVPPSVPDAGQNQQVSALASRGGSDGTVDSAQDGDRGKLAHQSGVPPLAAIEDTATEILEILKFRWNLELERRGVE